VCAVRYVKPWLQTALGQRPSKTPTAILTEEVNFSKQLTYFLTVKISYRFGHLLATPVPMKSSGDLAHLIRGDGVLELPAHLHSFKKGENYPFYAFRAMNF
jgi:molybdopterin molybdotransferase